ncbi:hypothetical protein [Acinetobacter baumannii]|uniref:Uncharacterized protein n=1 Tax=Acinetobacter baumannii TaxID=470 RepID=A0AA44XR60_ACIBA|nr:hypothetical protein [Acinetobacter baumannii]EKA71532.1 hypothetical protein ACINWC692_1132 [Acinetobacter baumannii WC-692]EKL57334.1 hypothetical protein ACIN5110_2547 [Acinetobacter baumannii OIFC110]MDC5269652.1 hypothetical protein [Acinetobacter baumannii]PQL81924.1 hypothetical protein CV954_014010 [Acinetobacter baumannii]TPT87898.1 hypothetical protein FJU55_02220 [Acinetobacter baumannii]
MSNFVFKRGDTFNLNLQLVDMDDALQYPANDVRRAIDLTGYSFTSQVKTLEGAAVATLTCAALSQSTQKGWLNVKSGASTATWPLGLCQMDIKAVVGGVIQHTETLVFQVIDGVTA